MTRELRRARQTIHDLASVFCLPGLIAGHKRRIWFLQRNQYRIVQRIVMKLGHAGKICLVSVAFKEAVNTLLQLLCDFLDRLLSV